MASMQRALCWLVSSLVGVACTPAPDDGDTIPAFRAVTFNTGTALELVDGAGENGGYGETQSALSDEHYGNGLAWAAAVAEVRAFFDATNADVVAFQEIFSSADCAAIPAEARAGFVCEDWQEGDPTVAQLAVGPDYAVACNLGKPDKCMAVKNSFGRLRGCEGGLCLDGLDGGTVEGCGGGSRIGRAVVELAAGGTLTVVGVHGTSGLTQPDMACRVEQFRQVFVDLKDGSGEPATNGEHNLVLGDFNTDPARLVGADPSADEINLHVSFETGFDFISPIGNDVTPTYAGLVNIDHVIGHTLGGSCTAAGFNGEAPVSAIRYFDHAPLVCDVAPR